MVLGERAVPLDVKPPSCLQQFALLDEFGQIDSWNARRLQITRAEQPHLADKPQQPFFVILRHISIIT